MPIALRAVGLSFFLIALPALADTQATYRCDNGKRFTITFKPGNNFCCAQMVFADTPRPIEMENQNGGSGATYVGGGWEYNEWHNEVSLTDVSKAARKEVSCHQVH